MDLTILINQTLIYQSIQVQKTHHEYVNYTTQIMNTALLKVNYVTSST